MGNEESQLGQAGHDASFSHAPSEARRLSGGNFRPSPQPPFSFSPPNSQTNPPGFRQVSPFNAPRNTTPQRFSGMTGNSGNRFPGPSSFVAASHSLPTGPVGLEVDLSGLSEAEKRQIAEVMARAQELDQGAGGAGGGGGSGGGGGKGGSQLKMPQPTTFRTSSNITTPKPPTSWPTSEARSRETTSTAAPEPKRSVLPQTASHHGLALKKQEQSIDLSAPQRWPSSRADIAVSPETKQWPKPFSEQQQSSLSRSFSSEEPLFSPEYTGSRIPLALPEKWQDDPSKAPSSTNGPSPARSQPGASAQVERCPLCRETELKIVTIHGKPQPLIGQLCARCSLIVCSKCGKVKKFSDQKTAYWLCTQCVDKPWTPPTDPTDLSTKADTFPDHSSAAVVKKQDSYVAPLTQLVTADNTVQSDAVRSSPALFFDDEPSYASLPVELSAAAAPADVRAVDKRYYSDEEDEPETVWRSDYANVDFSRRSPEQRLTRFHEDEPLRGVDSGRQGEPVFNEEDEFRYYDDEERSREPGGFKDDEFEHWPREEPSDRDMFPEPVPVYASQDSIYDIQEEETSDYGSQIQAACSDIASLSNSTSGGDFSSGNRGWPPAQNNAGLAHHAGWSENGHHHDRHHQDGDTGRGVPLRRSNLVENFRSMPVAVPTLTAPENSQSSQPRHPLAVNNKTKVPDQHQGQPASSRTSDNQQGHGNQTKKSGPESQDMPAVSRRDAGSTRNAQQNSQQIVQEEVESKRPAGAAAAGKKTGVTDSSHHHSRNTNRTHGSSLMMPDQTAQSDYSSHPGVDIEQQSNPHSSIQRISVPVSPIPQTSESDRTTEPRPPPPISPVPSCPSNLSHTQEIPANMSAIPQHSSQHHHQPQPASSYQSHEDARSSHYYSDSSVGRRRLIHQGSRDEFLAGQAGLIASEIDDFDSAQESVTDGGLNAGDFDTISQCSQMSTGSAIMAPHQSSASPPLKDGSMERRQKRRLPSLPKDGDHTGVAISAEEQERQKKELKRRLSGSLLRLARDGEPPSVDGVPRPISSQLDGPETGTKVAASKVAKRKKHKHLPATPHDHDAPKVQQLKQQLRMLAARKAGTGTEDEKRFGSLPNNPLNRFRSISGDEASSSTEYLTDSTFRSKPSANAPARNNHYASDPALFRSILDQYHQVALQEKRDKEREWGNWRDGNDPKDFGTYRTLQSHSDPEIQDIVARLQQFNRDLADTKELFRSTSNSLERRHVPKWKSDADLANRSWRREPDWDDQRVPSRHSHFHRHDPYLHQINNQENGNYYDPREQRRDVRSSMRGDPRFPQNNYQIPQNIDPRLYNQGLTDGEVSWNRNDTYLHQMAPLEFNVDVNGHPLFYTDQMPDQNYDLQFQQVPGNFFPNISISQQNAGYLKSGIPLQMDPTFLLPLPYLEATQYPGYNPMTDINNEDLSLYEPFDDPNFLPMGPGAPRFPTIPDMPVTLQNSQARQVNFVQPNNPSYQQTTAAGQNMLFEAPLFDSRVSCSDEPGKVDGWDEEKENLSETGSDGLNSTEKLSRSMSQKKTKKTEQRPKYPFATKRILLTRDPKDRSVSGNGLGVRIAGGKLIPNTNTLGAFISKIWDNGIMATLDEVKEGDQVLEWNGIPLTNKSYEDVQEILDAGNGEVEMLLRCDYNVRHLEAEVDHTRDRQLMMAQAERARLRDLDSGERSPLPTRLLSARKQDQNKVDDTDEIVYRPPNQLAPPSPGGMQRKKSTSSGHTPVTGDILLLMTYERCTLTLQVIKARNLKPADKSGFSDPYCKLSLVPGRANEYKYKTRHIMQTLNPEWKETFTFQSIDPNEIHHKQIEITVWDWDRLSADDFLGEVIVDLADPALMDGVKRWYTLGEKRIGVTEEQ